MVTGKNGPGLVSLMLMLKTLMFQNSVWPCLKYLIVIRLIFRLPTDTFYLTHLIIKCIKGNENDRIPIWISLKFVPRSPIDKNHISSGNGLAPKRRKTITWNNADLVHWRIYAALGGDELIPPYRTEFTFMSFVVTEKLKARKWSWLIL